MKLERIEINNFRSIKDITLDFKEKCKILVGKIESGKSNILKAISLLNNEISKSDIREEIHDEEETIKDSSVTFIFRFSDKEKERLFNDVKNSIFTSSPDPIIFIDKDKKISLKEYCKDLEGFYSIDLLEETKDSGIWILEEGITSNPEIGKLSFEDSEEKKFLDKEKNSIDYSKFEFVDSKDIDTTSTKIEEIEANDLKIFVENKVSKIIEKNLPACIFWEYNEKNLLPSSIKTTDFISNPDNFIPLKNIFNFAGHHNIPETIENSQLRSKGMRNLLNKISAKTTKHFHEVWPDYSSIKFEFNLNGEYIDISVVDEYNHFDFSQRSDGFKKFITFLFTISLKVKGKFLKNNIILLDEPSAGLHPSAEEALRKELIKISKENFVLYSTHSISMVDKENIKRHLIVKKNKEITTVEGVRESNITDEEVIYNALGYSMFKSLKEINLLFEGWKDKRLFQIAMKDFPEKYPHLVNFFNEIGQCHGQGTRRMKYITPLLDLANKRCLIISDNDESAKRYQKDYLKERGHGDWKCYDDIIELENVYTSEDFIRADSIIKKIKNLTKEYPYLNNLSKKDILSAKGKIFAIKNWLRKNKIIDEEQKKVIEKIKDEIFDNLKIEDIRDNYYEFLDALKYFLENGKIKEIEKKLPKVSNLPNLPKVSKVSNLPKVKTSLIQEKYEKIPYIKDYPRNLIKRTHVESSIFPNLKKKNL